MNILSDVFPSVHADKESTDQKETATKSKSSKKTRLPKKIESLSEGESKKERKPYVMTDARRAAFDKCVAVRAAKLQAAKLAKENKTEMHNGVKVAV